MPHALPQGKPYPGEPITYRLFDISDPLDVSQTFAYNASLLYFQVVKLSDAVQPLPRQTTAFVHGVPHSFIKVGEAKANAAADGKPRFDHGAYFIGKVNTAQQFLNRESQSFAV